MPIEYENIADTLTEYGEQYAALPDTPEAEIYVISEQELKQRRTARIIFYGSIVLIIGLLFYARKTKKK